jgi:Phage integrase central domain
VRSEITTASTLPLTSQATRPFQLYGPPPLSGVWIKSRQEVSKGRHLCATYVSPVVGKLPVSAVDTGLVLKVLEPIWSRKPETASRVRGRMEAVLDWAKVRGYRTGENLISWSGPRVQDFAVRSWPNCILRVNRSSSLSAVAPCAISLALSSNPPFFRRLRASITGRRLSFRGRALTPSHIVGRERSL